MDHSLRSRNYLWLSALSAGSALLFALVILVGQRWYDDRQSLGEELTVQAALIGANASAALVFADRAAGGEIVGTATGSPSILEAALYRVDGELLAHFSRSETSGTAFDAAAPAVGKVFSLSDLRIVVPVHVEGRTVGTIAIRATLRNLYWQLAKFAGSLMAIVAVAALLGQLASRRLRRRMTEAEVELQRMALYDRVSGLANRHAFELALEQTVRRHKRDGGGSILMFIDVDGFKKVNDRFGHSAGDQVLAGIGRRLLTELRGADVVARIGGDEFGAILVNSASPDDAGRVAKSLIQSAQEPFEIGATSAFIGFSIGIAMIPQDGDSAESLMNHADLAMYHAKKQGKGNHQFFSATIGDSVRHNLQIEADLRLAIERDELYVVYQPQVSAQDRRIEGLEALVRWRCPERGVISPAEFIPVAEESRLIFDVGHIVLDRVCGDIAGLRRAGYRVPRVAINISARQFVQGDVVKDIRACLDKFGLRPVDVEIELTESVLMGQDRDSSNALGELDDSGIRIAIDDFGTGYSSFSYLRRLPADKLKIDMSFVRDLPGNAESVAIVGGIISMAHALGLRVVAEGVETVEQARCLQSCSCDLLQGYLTGRPMGKAELEQLLDRQP